MSHWHERLFAVMAKNAPKTHSLLPYSSNPVIEWEFKLKFNEREVSFNFVFCSQTIFRNQAPSIDDNTPVQKEESL